MNKLKLIHTSSEFKLEINGVEIPKVIAYRVLADAKNQDTVELEISVISDMFEIEIDKSVKLTSQVVSKSFE